MTPHDAAGALLLAQGDAEVERRAGIAWLLGHPEEAGPLLVGAVRVGSYSSPETCLRVLAAIGGEGAVGAIEAALLRGHPGESFYAAVALSEAGEPGLAVLQSHADHPEAAVRDAVTAVSTRPPAGDGQGPDGPG